MSKLKSHVDRLLGNVLATAMGLAVLTVLWQVFSRYVLAAPSSFTDELVRYLLIWIGLLGGGYATGQHLHLAIDVLPRSLTGRARHLLDMMIQLVVFLFALGVMVVGGSHLVGLSLALGQTSAALGVPLGYVYLVLPLAGFIIMFYSGLFALKSLRQARGLEATSGLLPNERYGDDA